MDGSEWLRVDESEGVGDDMCLMSEIWSSAQAYSW